MRLIPSREDSWEAREVVLLDLAECQLFIDRLRALVDAHERSVTDALSYLPQERDQLPPVVPMDYFE